MLRFLGQVVWGAASWPLGMWLRALDTVANEATPASCPASGASDHNRPQAEQEEAALSDDAMMRPEIPEFLRDMMKMSIEQAKRAFDTFVTTSENSWKSIENSSQAARERLQALNAKIADITRSNAEANFALVMKLAESKDVQQAMELQSEHARNQMEAFARQLEELRDLTTKIIQEANPAKIEASTFSSPSQSDFAGPKDESASTY
jgi:phasin